MKGLIVGVSHFPILGENLLQLPLTIIEDNISKTLLPTYENISTIFFRFHLLRPPSSSPSSASL